MSLNNARLDSLGDKLDAQAEAVVLKAEQDREIEEAKLEKEKRSRASRKEAK